MKPFHYYRAKSVKEVCDVLAELAPNAHILAGGTDVLIELRRSSAKSSAAIIDIFGIKEMAGIEVNDRMIQLGPLATHADVACADILKQFAPLLSAAASTVGSPQIRNRGTVGGNIMNAAACADTMPPLVALDAEVTLSSSKGSRRLQLCDLIEKPYATKAHADEILTKIEFRKLEKNYLSAFVKLGRRNALSISRLSVAAILGFDSQGKINDARIVPGAAFPRWRRITEAEKMLIGERPSQNLFASAGKKVSEEMIAQVGRRWSTEYKEPVIAVLVRRALEQCSI